MKEHKIKHVFFDLDHTLWDFDKNSELTFDFMFQKNKIDIQIEEFLKVYMPINLKFWRLYRENLIKKEDLRFRRLKESFDLLKIDMEDELINILSEDYIKHLPDHNHLLDGTFEILQYLKPKYKLHIITNGFQEVQKTKIHNSRIDSFFSSITTSEEAGFKKPHENIFKHAFRKSNAVKENSIMIGDSLEADILGGQQVGMKTIFFNYYKAECSPNYVAVEHLLDLKKHL